MNTKKTNLVSELSYRDFELSFKARLTERRPGVGRSGVVFRSRIVDQKDLNVRGFQFVIAAPGSEKLVGSVIAEPSIGSEHEFISDELISMVYRKDDFNEFSIRCVGKHVTTTLNSLTILDEDFRDMVDNGVIAWQLPGMLARRRWCSRTSRSGYSAHRDWVRRRRRRSRCLLRRPPSNRRLPPTRPQWARSGSGSDNPQPAANRTAR